MKPTAEQQLQFLQHLQLLFEDGNFVATYKYALLMSLAELAVESGDTDGELPISMTQIAEKFAELYWPQTAPYSSGLPGTSTLVLLQNQGKQAAVVNALLTLRAEGAATAAQAKQLKSWPAAIRQIATTVAGMPVQYLQNVGGTLVPFLYNYPHAKGRIDLKPGVSAMLRTFQPLIQQLSRTGWVRHVRENQLNAPVIGQVDELEQFMFSSSRNALSAAAPILAKMQAKRCFYCSEGLHGSADVDHFIPWVKYPRDLAHNFVLAHSGCNRSKSDMLAAEVHLENWIERNLRFGSELTGSLTGFMADADCSVRVARWAYELGVGAGAHGWLNSTSTKLLGPECLELLAA
jgi:5-methylcytosine-specific restriction endonuclease McrA